MATGCLPTYLNGNFDFLQNLQCLLARLIEAFVENALMQTFGQENIGLLQQFTDQQNGRCGSVASHIVLGGGRTGDQRRRWMLNLHFMQKHITVLGDFNIAGTRDQPELNKNNPKH